MRYWADHQDIGYQNYDTILPYNHTEGIWLLDTNDNVEVKVIAKEVRAIHCTTYETTTAKLCARTLVYALA